ncbi:hypothetical protein ACFCV3_20195 [Kribbella sp. NPDC056345]|uniref:hypothetical protein n=1 Tax=Kribbella sp. NPDC056345 TaxID=3345789 RepID=UPI0035E2EC4E
MTGKRDKGAGDSNPWVSKPGPDEDPAAAPAPALPPSPWNLEVPPAPGGTASPWSGPGPEQGDGPATETSSAWGDKVGPPSLRRPPPAKKRPRIPPVLLPIGAGLVVVALVAVALVLLSGGGGKSADPIPSTTPSASTPTTSYTPPAGAIPVAFGVSVVPAPGWSVLETEKQGKELVTYAPNGEARAFFWVRQKENVTAKAYLLAIIEGETENEIAKLGDERNLPCPKDVLEECIAMSYTSTAKDKAGQDVAVQGYVEVYLRKDKVATALDFRTRTDFAPKAEADAAQMKTSVLDSL